MKVSEMIAELNARKATLKVRFAAISGGAMESRKLARDQGYQPVTRTYSTYHADEIEMLLDAWDQLLVGGIQPRLLRHSTNRYEIWRANRSR